jgi:hypothetical protein
VENSGFDLVLKGRGFSRAVSAAKLMAALQAAEKVINSAGSSPQALKREHIFRDLRHD